MGWRVRRVFYKLSFSARVECPILLIKVIVILTNKKDFIIMGGLGFKEGVNILIEISVLPYLLFYLFPDLATTDL